MVNISSTTEVNRLQAELLESSFEKIQPQANEFISSFFDTLFIKDSTAKSLFASISKPHRNNQALSSLMFIVENAKKQGALEEALAGLGSHQSSAETAEKYHSPISEALSETFAQYLGGNWTPEVEQAWASTYRVIAQVMVAEVDVAADVDEATGLKIKLLEQSFEKVKPYANEFVPSFYDNLFTDYPAAKPLFAHTDMGDQGRKLLASLVFVIENLRRPGELTGALKGLGARHVKYGALPEHYPLVGNTLLKTFEQYLEADWTPETKQAWVEAYGLITQVMLEGADYSAESVQLESAAPAVEAPEGIGTGATAGIIGGGAVVLVLLLLLF
ncbi:MAG: globin domain-containing protein [Cyanobacteria bacterium P01_H01_bin.119]